MRSLINQNVSINQRTKMISFRSSFARFTLFNLGMQLILLISGALVAGSGTASACTAWPICTNNGLPMNPDEWINFTHRLVVLAAGITMISLLLKAWKTQRSQIGILVTTTAGAVLFIAQALLGARLAVENPTYLAYLHKATAIAVWAVLITQATLVVIGRRTTEEEQIEGNSLKSRRAHLKDLLLLTKPIVVALLLVTTFAGMVIGAQAWPSLRLTLWTLLAGFMAAGGSGAINQYIDRNDDQKMQRTQKRPIPSGRLTPAEGLAFGVGMVLASFYLMATFVNLFAALLSLIGMIYYVVLYSILLKKSTVQNIVIGGGAGAIPPLVGWAAVTGRLDLQALLLFAVVFMWTPPHFWALALVRKNDYARAGVPMLPVVRGEEATRNQIFIYTLELVVLTLLLPLFGLGSSIYLIGAVALGGWLLRAAWKVWRQGGNKLAWKMYRYSSMYLAFLFFVLMIDRII